jgi:hypothetical protein
MLRELGLNAPRSRLLGSPTGVAPFSRWPALKAVVLRLSHPAVDGGNRIEGILSRDRRALPRADVHFMENN